MDTKILIVTANYYEEISNGLYQGALGLLKKNNISFDSIDVPGSFEISLAIKSNINKNIYDGFIGLGCIIKGQTYHFELLSNECIRSISSLSLNYNVPIGFGIITCNNIGEAKARSRFDEKNKGKEAASACLKMINLLKNTK